MHILDLLLLRLKLHHRQNIKKNHQCQFLSYCCIIHNYNNFETLIIINDCATIDYIHSECEENHWNCTPNSAKTQQSIRLNLICKLNLISVIFVIVLGQKALLMHFHCKLRIKIKAIIFATLSDNGH